MMKTSYKKLWKLLIDRDMTKTDLRKAAGICSSSLAKLGKDENITTDVLMKICRALDVELNDIVETVKEKILMDDQTYNKIVSFIWGIADDCLRDVYVRGKYRDVILPMTVIGA